MLFRSTGHYRYNKITHFNGRFYVFDCDKRNFVLEVEKIQDSISTRIIAYDDPWKGHLKLGNKRAFTSTWLAESSGALMMVFVRS